MIPLLIDALLAPERARIPEDEPAWKQFFALATQHGVAPLLWLRLGKRELPAAARAQLQSIYLRNVIRIEALQAETAALIAALATAGVPVWTLKGPEVGRRLYGDSAARMVNDIDLLTRPSDFAAADLALAGAGYSRQARGDFSVFADAQELLYVKPTGQQDGTPFAVDLHQRLQPYAPRDPFAERIRSAGFTEENLLLYLCLNEVTHRFAYFKHFLDVEAQLRRCGAAMQWEQFLAAARELDVVPGIFHALDLSVRFAGAPVPDAVVQALAPRASEATRFRRRVGATLQEFLARGPLRDGPGGARVTLLCMNPGAVRRQALWRMLVPPESYLRQELSADPREPLLKLRVRRWLRKLRTAPGPIAAAGTWSLLEKQ